MFEPLLAACVQVRCLLCSMLTKVMPTLLGFANTPNLAIASISMYGPISL